MSLIGEALKRLSEEERPPHLGRPHLPVPRRSPWPWVVAAAAVSLAVGVIVGVALLPRSSPSPTIAARPGATAAGAAETLPSTPEPAVTATTPLEAAVEPMVGTRKPSPQRGESGLEGDSGPWAEEESTPTSNTTLGSEPLGTEIDTYVVAEPPLAAPSTVAELEVPRPEAGRTYFGRVVLPDGDEIVLNGIAWSDTSPVALLDSGVFSPGEGANTWVIAAIEPRQVEIEWEGIRFYVRMR